MTEELERLDYYGGKKHSITLRKGDTIWIKNPTRDILCIVDKLEWNGLCNIIHMTEIENGAKHWTEHIERIAIAKRKPEHLCYYRRGRNK